MDREETIYKLTSDRRTTRGCMLWGINVSHAATGRGSPVLCSDTVIHAYRTPEIAVFCNAIHADYHRPLLWEARGIVVCDDGLKLGCKSLMTLKRIELPHISNHRCTEIGILMRDPGFAFMSDRELQETTSAHAYQAKWNVWQLSQIVALQGEDALAFSERLQALLVADDGGS